MSWVSRSSTLHGQFPDHSLVDVRHLAILTKARCKHIELLIDVICTMAMNDGNHVKFPAVFGPPGSVGS